MAVSSSDETSVVESSKTEIVVSRDQESTVIQSGGSSVVVENEKKSTVITEQQQTEVVLSCCLVRVEHGEPACIGSVFVTSITGQGIIADIVYDPDTVPANKVITEATTDNDAVTIHFMAEGGRDNYSPVVFVDGIECTNLQQFVDDQRLFYGSVDIQVTETREVEIVSDTGCTTTVLVNRAAAGPAILSCVIGPYPGLQTAAKAGDVVHVTGTVEQSATHVRLISYGAFKATDWIPVTDGTFDIAGTVSSLTGWQDAMVEAVNALGTVGDQFLSENEILLDQTFPQFIDNGTTFPTGQAAFKGTEAGAQSTTVLYADLWEYSSPHGDFVIANPSLYEEEKAISCTNPGDYNDSSVNFQIVATRSANGATSTFSKVIEVADVAPVVTVTQPQARLQSAPLGADYIITATSNQNLAGPPSIGIPVSGTWQGTGFSGGPKTWTRTIRIYDSDQKGEAPWFWDGAAPTNRAGLPAEIIGLENVGGFMQRDIELAAFATEAELPTAVTDTSKLSMTWSFKDPMLFQPIGTQPPVVYGWTISGLNENPTTIIILDTQAAAASSQASIITIAEAV